MRVSVRRVREKVSVSSRALPAAAVLVRSSSRPLAPERTAPQSDPSFEVPRSTTRSAAWGDVGEI